MAYPAILRRRQVPYRRLAQGSDIVVATVTALAFNRSIIVIDPGAEKTQVIMASATIQGDRYMTIGFAGTDGIVVAVATSILRQISCAVVKKASGESARAMTADTIFRRG